MKLNKKLVEYEWAANALKLQRAIAKAKEQANTDGSELTEDLVLDWYIKLGGQVLETVRKVRKNADKASVEDSQE